MDFVMTHIGLIALILLVTIALVAWKQLVRLFGAVIVPDNMLGIVRKKFTMMGNYLPDGKIVAINNEAGIQADTLAPGLHWGFWPWQYEVRTETFTAIAQGFIGIVEAKDGEALNAGRVLARTVACDSFQNARAFLNNKGQRGPQISIIPPGTFRINTAVFKVSTVKATFISDNMIGVVTTKEGVPLKTGDIAGPEVPGHNLFQDGEAFIQSKGCKGLQEQVLLAGQYFINPWFATVEEKSLTPVPIANVGVVISYVGPDGVDVTGESFKHGNLVKRKEKGVWVDPLDPGKYPINPYTQGVELVPTANVVLNWATGKTEAHKLDANLSTITVRSSDGFKFNLDVSQIIHIPRADAPKVIARFGSVANLVTQVLEPTIGNYFRNAAQASDVIDFLRNRDERQKQAKKAIGDALQDYNVGAVDTLIGDIVPPEELMKTLTDRKLAEQEQITFKTQQIAEDARKEMQQARAMADTQPTVVNAERKVAIAEFDAKSSIAKAEGDARSKTINAEADAKVTGLTGDAQAAKTLAVGRAEAEVIEKKTVAVGQSNYAVMEVARSLSENKIKLVPDVVAGGSDGKNGTLVDVLLANLITNNKNHNNTDTENR